MSGSSSGGGVRARARILGSLVLDEAFQSSKSKQRQGGPGVSSSGLQPWIVLFLWIPSAPELIVELPFKKLLLAWCKVNDDWKNVYERGCRGCRG